MNGCTLGAACLPSFQPVTATPHGIASAITLPDYAAECPSAPGAKEKAVPDIGWVGVDEPFINQAFSLRLFILNLDLQVARAEL